MKKTLLLSLFVIGLAVFSLPAALITVNAGKEKILISEEVLSGNPAEAAGITLKMPSHWDRRLLWDTEYTVGSGKEAESHFSFSSKPVSWGAPETIADAGLLLDMKLLFGTTDLGSGHTDYATSLDWKNDLYTAMINGTAEHTEKGEKYTEIVRIGDYDPNYPLIFAIDGYSVYYEGDYDEACDHLKNFFHIGTAEDQMEVTVELNGQGDITAAGARLIGSDETVSITHAAADDGEGGLYFTYCLTNARTGKWADRGQNMGIFYFPYRERKSFWHMDLTQVQKLCDYPGNAIPLQMLVDSEEGILYLAVKVEENYALLIYQLEEKIPVLRQQVPVKQDNPPSFCKMTLEDGGVLLTWDDNRFAFIARENGQYRQWCSGVFPENGERNFGNPFPKEQVCLFNGERLFLAAYESWYSTNVLLSVYDEQGQTYSGRYVHSEQEDRDMGYDFRSGIAPQGIRPESQEFSFRTGMGDEPVKPLELFFAP